MAKVITRSHCDLVFKLNKLIKKVYGKKRRDPGHGVCIHIRFKLLSVLFPILGSFIKRLKMYLKDFNKTNNLLKFLM